MPVPLGSAVRLVGALRFCELVLLVPQPGPGPSGRLSLSLFGVGGPGRLFARKAQALAPDRASEKLVAPMSTFLRPRASALSPASGRMLVVLAFLHLAVLDLQDLQGVHKQIAFAACCAS
jgi:hypothetical protein